MRACDIGGKKFRGYIPKDTQMVVFKVIKKTYKNRSLKYEKKNESITFETSI